MLTYSLLFSWLDPTAYFAAGAWSIGNEWAFYTLFPLLLISWHRGWRVFGAVLLVCVMVGMYFAFVVLDPRLTPKQQWPLYISPLNQLPLFALGVALAIPILRQGVNNRLACLVGGIATFVFIVFAARLQALTGASVAGLYRVLFVAISVAWCYAGGISHVTGMLGSVAGWLGKVSYSVYLLHPIVFSYLAIATRKTGFRLDPVVSAFFVALPLTLFASAVCFYLIERPCQNLGKRVVQRWGVRARTLS